ncbi:MAG: hypothetical protein LCH53_13595 [Bacteroidetes bacterium]|nr:hypothetical protein [Bacteroidota bacterium]
MKTYRPYETLDADLALATPTVERITAVREHTVQAASVARAEREGVCQVMNWPKDRVVDDLSEVEYIEAVAEILFPMPTGTDRPKTGLIRRVVYDAMLDFFG